MNRPGFGHLAFRVRDVAAARETVLAAVGGEVGPLTTAPVDGLGTLSFVYLTDPEGNVLELQRWG